MLQQTNANTLSYKQTHDPLPAVMKCAPGAGEAFIGE